MAKSSFNPQDEISLEEISNCFEIVSKAINYPLILKEFALERSPHSLVHFVKDFSATFHSFYEQNPVLSDDKITSNSRLLITSITKLILKNSKYAIIDADALTCFKAKPGELYKLLDKNMNMCFI